jgi:uncharacterized protein (DUF302 family)
MTKQSRYSHAETVARLTNALKESGNTIFATIDQAAAATGAGLALRPTTLIIFGNPKAGTPFMDAFPLTGLALPLKFLVWEDDGAVYVAYETMSEIAARYGVTGLDDRIATIDAALDKLSSVTVSS